MTVGQMHDQRDGIYRLTPVAAVLTVLWITGCANIGPGTIARDRFDYVSAISESWKRQTLLNLVKMRYVDAPVFMDVAAVINQYALESEIESSFSWSNRGFVGGQGKFIDRPTITYNPVMGERFARTFLRPIPIPAVMLLIQAGYPADYIFQLCIFAVNGLYNGRSGHINAQPADPDYFVLVDALYRLQKQRAFTVRTRLNEDKQQLLFVFNPLKNRKAAADQERVKQLLGLNKEASEFPIVHGTFAQNDGEVAIFTRSLYLVMHELAACISVPEPDVADGRVYKVAPRQVETQDRMQPCLWVQSTKTKPESAFVDVGYRNRWFWIDDCDLHTKEMFNFLLLLFSFAENGETGPSAPILTIPTN